MKFSFFRSDAFILVAFIWATGALFLKPAGDIMSDASLATAVGVVDRGSLALGPDMAIDLSRVGDKYYSGLGPGLWFAAVPYYLALKPVMEFLPRNLPIFSTPPALVIPKRVSREVYLLHAALVLFLVLPLGAALALQVFQMARDRGASRKRAYLLAVALCFGSLLFAYSGVYSKDALSALVLWNVGLLLFRRIWTGTVTMMFAGLALGWSVSMNYEIIFAVGIMVLGLAYRDGVKAVLPLVAGVSAGGVLIAMYQYWVFGNPFATPYEFRIWMNASVPYKGTFVNFSKDFAYESVRLGWPSVRALFGLTFSPFKGLFIYCPVLILGFYGFVQAIRSKASRETRAFIGVCVAIFGVYLLLLSAMHIRSGDPLVEEILWSGTLIFFGPRFLLATIPGLVCLLLFLNESRRVGGGLAFMVLLSVGINVLGAMYFDLLLRQPYESIASQRALVYLFGKVLSEGLRIPGMEYYGLSPQVQMGIILAWALFSAGVTDRFFRGPNPPTATMSSFHVSQ